MKKYFLIVSLLFFLCPYTHGKISVLSGQAKDYAGKQLFLMKYTDEIIFSEEIVDSVMVDSAGYFQFQIKVENTAYYFIPLPVYQAFLFVEPGVNYQIELPPYIALSFSQSFNPYFSKEKLLLNIIDKDEKDLNHQIFIFENLYNYYYLTSALYPHLDSINKRITSLEEYFGTNTHAYFQEYRQYKYALMLELDTKNSPFLAIDTYLKKTPINDKNMAFWEMFNSMFDNFIDKFPFTEEAHLISLAINTQSIQDFKNVLKNKFYLEDTNLQELIIIKSLYDAYYSDKHDAFFIKNLMHLWKEEILLAENKQKMQDVIDKLSINAPYTSAYNLKLKDEKGKFRKLSDYQGKFIYLNFCNTQISLSKRDFGILTRYGSVYKKDLIIINVFTDENKEEAISFLRSIKSPNINLFTEYNQQVLKEYGIKNIPSYFLLDREGNFLLSPAPTPYENFDLEFEKILQEEKIKKINQNSEKNWWDN